MGKCLGGGRILLFMSDADVIQSEAGKSREGKQVKGTCCIGRGAPPRPLACQQIITLCLQRAASTVQEPSMANKK